MCLEIGRVDHQRLLLAVFGGQPGHHLSEDTLVAPPLPAIVKPLVGAILFRCISPTQPIAVDKDNSAQHTTIIDARLAMGLWKVGRKARHLRIAQPEEISHIAVPFWRGESSHVGEINGS